MKGYMVFNTPIKYSEILFLGEEICKWVQNMKQFILSIHTEKL